MTNDNLQQTVGLVKTTIATLPLPPEGFTLEGGGAVSYTHLTLPTNREV